MNIFLLGLKVTSSPQLDEAGKTINVSAVSLPSSDKRVETKVQLIQKPDHYVGKILNRVEKDQTIMAIGPTRSTPDGMLQMQPMLVVTNENFNDVLAVNIFVAAGGLGPKADEIELSDTTVTNRSLAWKTEEDSETNWFKLAAWGDLSKQLSEMPNGTPTIAVGKVTTSEKEERAFLNYTLDKVLYLPKQTKSAPKKAVDPEKGKVAAAALGSLDFSL